MIKFNFKSKYLFSYVIISFIVSIILYIVSLKLSAWAALFEGLFLFVPAIIVAFIYFLFTKTLNKFPVVTKIIATIINIFIIFFIQILFSGLCTIMFTSVSSKDVQIAPEYPNVLDAKDYKHVLESIGYKDRVEHFPKEVPKNVSNIKLKKSANYWFGSEEILLSFVSDKVYIDNELIKHKFKKIEGPFKAQYDYDYPVRYLDCNNLDITKYKHYILQRGDTRHNIYSSGFLINEKTNEIIYYYVFPD